MVTKFSANLDSIDCFSNVKVFFEEKVMGEFHVQKVGEDGRTEIPAMAFWHRCIA